MNRVVHFEFNVPDAKQAVDFYKGVFGWTVQQWGDSDYWLVTTGTEFPGIDGAIMTSRDGRPRTVNVVEVAAMDDALAAVEREGGQIVVPKAAVPGIGWQAYCTDPGGTIFGLMQNDTTAA